MLSEAGDDASGVLVGTVEVTDENHQVVVGYRLGHTVQRRVKHARIGSCARIRPKGPVLFNKSVEDTEDRLFGAVGANLLHLGVIEDHGADSIPLVRHPPGPGSGDLGGGHRLHVHLGAVEHGDPLIYEKDRRPVPFLRENPYMWLSGSGRDLPIDGSGIVPGQVDPELLEVQTPAPDPGRVAAGQEGVDGLSGQEREPSSSILERDQFLQGDVYACLAHGGLKPDCP